MDVEAAEFQEWEMLYSNRASDSEPITPADSAGNMNGLEEVGSETGGVVQPNYFSIDSQIRHMSTFTGADGCEEDSEQSDNPSWIDPGSDNHFTMKKNSHESGSDSGGEFEGKNKLGFEEIKSENGKEFCPDSVEFGAGQNSHLQDEENGSDEVEQRDQKRRLVWWKLPIQLVKYCAAFRVSPAWTFSATAVMAFVILVGRLYKMKKKTKALELKVTVNDKNVSQFAFSIVKRVPVIRTQLPAAGDTLWPLMSLR